MDESLAYVAGFYEGEGSIGCYLQPRKYVPDYPAMSLSIPQNYIEPLERVRDTMGYGAIDENRGGVRYVYRIQSYDECRDFIERVRPMLSPRRIEQAEKAFALADSQRELLERYRETCRNGHNWNSDESYRIDKRGRRVCRECSREANRRYRRRKRGEE